MKRKPEPWEDAWWWHSKPVARSLHVLEELDLLVNCRGRTDKIARDAFMSFCVTIKVTPLSPCPYVKLDQHGKPAGAYLPGDVFRVTSRRDLHSIAQEALRRAEQAKNEEEP